MADRILPQKETFLIIGTISLALLLTSLAFFWLWASFKIGFVWLIAFFLIFISRKTDSWKLGLECFMFLSFLFSYVYSLWFTLPMVYAALILVVKFRPDELNGVLAHSIALTGVALLGSYFGGLYGLHPSTHNFLFAALASISFGVVFDFFIALKIAPVHWFKNFMNHLLDMMMNYFYITTFGLSLLYFLASIN